MLKNIVAMSRDDCEDWAKAPHNEQSAVISIKSRFDKSTPNVCPSNENNIKLILRMTFNDAENDIEGGISKEEAKRIARFVNTVNESGIENIIVHCDMGQSRSQGVAAAISKFFKGDDSEYYRTATPSALCHWRVLEALHNLDDERIINEVLA